MEKFLDRAKKTAALGVNRFQQFVFKIILSLILYHIIKNEPYPLDHQKYVIGEGVVLLNISKSLQAFSQLSY